MTNLTIDPVKLNLPSCESNAGWCLTGCLGHDVAATTVSLARFPFVIGREANCDATVASRNVSKRHAEFLSTIGAVLVRDLHSTNGTFVNGHRITQPTPIGDGDLIRVADVELQLCRQVLKVVDRTTVADVSEHMGNISRMQEVIGQQRMTIYYQPIVLGANAEPFGYEALVRTDVPGLESPLALFSTAESLGLEKRLSVLCRELAMKTIHRAGLPGVLFLNTHPHEALDDTMVESLASLLQEFGPRKVVLEIHEEAVGDIESLRHFKAQLNRIGVKLAFDDFGVGQSRLLELASVRPDYIKFDRSLVRDLGTPSAAHAPLVVNLHQHAMELGIATLAEGLESPESISACREIGFEYYQGFAFGRPKPLS